MRKIYLIFILSIVFCCKDKKQEEGSQSIENSKAGFSIVIHGGAGTILKQNITPEKEIAYRQALEAAIRTGYDILNHGGNSLDEFFGSLLNIVR